MTLQIWMIPTQHGNKPSSPSIALFSTFKTLTNYMIIFRFQWHFNGQKLNGNDVSLIISPDAFSSSLSFTSLRTSHSGNYTCEAKNAASSDKYSSHLLVNGNFFDFLEYFGIFRNFSEFFGIFQKFVIKPLRKLHLWGQQRSL